MKPVVWLLPSCSLMLFLSSCTKNDPTAATGPGYGPFDADGNYIEEFADDPSKWRRPGTRGSAPADVPAIAKNDQPPANANPLAPKIESSPRPTTRSTETTKPVVVAQNKPRETSRPTTVTKETTTARPKPKSTPVKVKPKVKPKPKTTRYIVKSGDSLSRIAARNGSSVSAIQKANGISGTLIRPGQSLVIPKR